MNGFSRIYNEEEDNTILMTKKLNMLILKHIKILELIVNMCIRYGHLLHGEGMEEIWLSPMTKAPIPTEKFKTPIYIISAPDR